jgi:predicted site-specific integrase-resolvase
MTIKLLTTDQAAEILNVKTATLRVWRMQGKGPRFRKIGALVRYAEADLAAFIDAQTRSSTSQRAQPAEAALA